MVEHSSGRLLTRCVGFLEDQISGLQLIQRSGVEYQAQQFAGLGSAICQLDYEPQSVPSGCLPTGAYWQYFHRAPSGWIASAAGASSWSLHDGDMDGWHYASGAAQAPVNITFQSVCEPTSPSASAPSRTPAATSATFRTPPPRPAAVVSSPSVPPTANTTASLEAMAPTVSSSARTALAQTGSLPPRPPPTPIGPLLLMAVGVGSLLLLGYLNLRRRAP